MIRMIAFAGAMMVPSSVFAELTGWRVSNPAAWMHSPPVGETPGWSTPTWFNFEISHGNIWNMRSEFTDRRTGDVYTYTADYEQTNAVIESGFAIGPAAFAFEIPYASHNAGFLDDFIDQFHTFGRFDRFLREFHHKFANSFVIQKNGVDMIATHRPSGVGNIKSKLKWWLLPWKSPTPGVCECGFSLSAQMTFPVQRRELGLTSGSHNVSGLAHLGVPFGQLNGAWFTAAVTKLGHNPTFEGWPQRQWQQMYELSLNIGITKNLGIILQARVESPLFEQKYLDFNYQQTDSYAMGAEREASAWNALTEWRASENAGLVWRWGQGSQINFLIVEDWGLGDRDHAGTWNYVNNAPDVSFVTQWHLVF